MPSPFWSITANRPISLQFWIHPSPSTASIGWPMIAVGRVGSSIESLLNVASAGRREVEQEDEEQ